MTHPKKGRVARGVLLISGMNAWNGTLKLNLNVPNLLTVACLAAGLGIAPEVLARPMEQDGPARTAAHWKASKARAGLFKSKKVRRELTEQEISLAETVKLLRKKVKGISTSEANLMARQVVFLSRLYRFRVSFILAVIRAESAYDPNVSSNMGAIGLMQLQPETAKYINDYYEMRLYKNPKDLRNPWINVTLGIRYLAYLRDKFGSRTNYLSAYNLGPAKMRKLGVPERGVQHLSGVNRYIASIRKGELLINEEHRRLRNGS